MLNNITHNQLPTRNNCQQTELEKMATCSEACAPDITVNCRINAPYFEYKFHVLIYPKESLKWLRISVYLIYLLICD